MIFIHLFFIGVVMQIQCFIVNADSDVFGRDFEKRSLLKNEILVANDMLEKLREDIYELTVTVNNLEAFKFTIENKGGCEENLGVCKNGGSCQQRIYGYKCMCVPGFSGQNCEDDIGAHGTFILQVTNGVLVGTWYPFEFCPTGYMATGFRVQMQVYYGQGLSGFEVKCTAVNSNETSIVSFIINDQEDFWAWQDCDPDYYLVQFQLKTEAVSPVWSHYDMYYEHYGVDEVHMTCRGPGLSGTNEMLLSPDTTSDHGIPSDNAEWGTESDACPAGEVICGFALKVFSDVYYYPAVAVSDLMFKCCYLY